MSPHRVGAVPEAQDKLTHPGPPQPHDQVLQERAAGERRQRLGLLAQERTQARPQPARQEQRLHARCLSHPAA